MRENQKLAWLVIAAWLCIISSLINGAVEAAPQSARVQRLPGFNGSFPSEHYAGYIDVGKKHLFYYFIQSERDPVKDPVVLWLNGGPGCSSFDGFVYEHGPFDFGSGKKLPKLYLNQYSWSKVSNIIYLDSPAGVGFSYSDNTNDYETSDLKTASDTHNFLIKWFQQYPDFRPNPFFVAGESYAGIYVPTLVSAIAAGNEAGGKPVIKIKGYMIGNGVTDRLFDGNALVPFVHGMALIPDDLFKETESACNGSYYNPQTDACSKLIQKINGLVSGLNIYDILEPCYYGGPGSNSKKENNSALPPSFTQLGLDSGKIMGVRKRMFGRAWPFRAPVLDGIVPSWPQLLSGISSGVPCINDEVATVWLNNEDVRKAIHAKPISAIGEWDLCSGKLIYTHDASSMLPYHRNLTAKGYRALIFSGDHDMCVPYTGSEAWTNSLGYKTIDEWRPWLVDDQIAGYVRGYDKNLTFLTIKVSILLTSLFVLICFCPCLLVSR
uniref:Carboxypeptidase n=1 Tax=Kalanchoe fedtschenkoi TaxID=63787 RepID=A0A7N0VIR1_KALFE